MDIRYSCNQRDFKRYTTEEIRKEFLIEKLFEADKVTAVYSHVDRMVTLGVMPVKEKVSIDKGIDIWHNFGTTFFLERRECGNRGVIARFVDALRLENVEMNGITGERIDAVDVQRIIELPENNT